jgi:hypothetical protein
MSTVSMPDAMPDQPGCTRLDRAACMGRLASTDRGRMAISVGALPVIVPVRYAVVDGRIEFPVVTDEAWRATDDRVVAFNAEGVDPGGHLWSVGVLARAHHLPGPGERRAGLSIERLSGHRET